MTSQFPAKAALQHSICKPIKLNFSLLSSFSYIIKMQKLTNKLNNFYQNIGIHTRIYYVNNGFLNTYPLAFAIPLGYNQSDIIFNWQNLGTSNVSYSISLVITNIEAVDMPLINITRSGYIPRHEQGKLLACR